MCRSAATSPGAMQAALMHKLTLAFHLLSGFAVPLRDLDGSRWGWRMLYDNMYNIILLTVLLNIVFGTSSSCNLWFGRVW